MELQSGLDDLIRAQNQAVLGTEDVRNVLSQYRAKREQAAPQAAAPRFAPEPPPHAPAPEGRRAQQPPPAHRQAAPYGESAQPSPRGAVHTSVRVHRDGSAVNSAQMEAMLNPVRNERDAMKRAGLHPHNHHRDNVGKIREMQQEVAAKKAFAEQAGQRTDEQRRRAREQALATAQRAGAQPVAPARPASKQAALPGRHTSYGKVPSYLAERTRAKEAEEALARAEAAQRASCPPGARSRAAALARAPAPSRRPRAHPRAPMRVLRVRAAGTRLVTEEERGAVLATIGAREAELRKELNSLPFVTKTLSTANRKQALEARLEEIEEARAQYSKPRVYVALDH